MPRLTRMSLFAVLLLTVLACKVYGQDAVDQGDFVFNVAAAQPEPLSEAEFIEFAQNFTFEIEFANQSAGAERLGICQNYPWTIDIFSPVIFPEGVALEMSMYGAYENHWPSNKNIFYGVIEDRRQSDFEKYGESKYWVWIGEKCNQLLINKVNVAAFDIEWWVPVCIDVTLYHPGGFIEHFRAYPEIELSEDTHGMVSQVYRRREGDIAETCYYG